MHLRRQKQNKAIKIRVKAGETGSEKEKNFIKDYDNTDFGSDINSGNTAISDTCS